MRTSACRKSSFRQAVRLSRMCLNFVFFRASLYKSTAARKKTKNANAPKSSGFGAFHKKIKICLQMINKKLFFDITKHNVSLRRGSGALSTVCRLAWKNEPIIFFIADYFFFYWNHYIIMVFCILENRWRESLYENQSFY